MSFLSNIGHSIAHIAEEAVTDIANSASGGLASTITNLAKTGLDSFVKDISGGLEGFGKSLLGKLGQDLVQQFSQPGGLKPPTDPSGLPTTVDASQGGTTTAPTTTAPATTGTHHKHHHHHHHHKGATSGTPTAPTTVDPSQGGVSGTPGYSPLPSAPTAQGDIGVIGNGTSGVPSNPNNDAALPNWTPVNVTNAGPATTSDVKPASSNQGTGDPELDAILHNPGATVQDKIFALLMKLSDKKEKELDSSINKLGAKDQPSQADLANLQRVQNQLSELTQLTTNMMKSYKDMKDSIIGNIR